MMNPNTASTLRVAAYCRIAAGGEEQESFLNAQKTSYAEKISANPDWTMAGIFADTGDSRSKRPAFQKMLQKCRQKKIDLILVKSISRFARNMADCLAIVRELRELGIAVEFEMEQINTLSPDCDCCISIMDAIAKMESENVSHHICNGRFPHMAAGKLPKGTWKKTIRLPGLPEKTIIFRME